MKDWLPGYVRQIADNLGLKDWRIECRDAEESCNITITVQFVRNRRFAVLLVRPPFWEDTPEDKRQTVVHECLHCHLLSVQDSFEETVEASGALTETMRIIAEASMIRAQEHAVDGIAGAIAGFYPLPPENDDARGA